MDKYHIPQHLDEPFKLILWTLDEVLVFAVPFFSGLLLLSQPLLGFIIGSALVFVLKKMKGEEGHYFIYQLMYWYLPTIVRFKATPPSCVRLWIG